KDVVSGQVTITNEGTLPATLSLTEIDDTNGFDANLQMVVTNVTDEKTVYTGTFGGLTTADLGQLAAGASKTLKWTVTLDAATGNEYQGKAAQAAYTWDAVQLNP